MVTVNDVIAVIEGIAKPEYAYEWDNCGLAVGNRFQAVDKVLVALDCTSAVVDEAIALGCKLIITHHPLIFKAIKKATVDTYEGEIISKLYKNDISLFCAHTNLDVAPDGVNDALALKLDLNNIKMLAPFNVGNDTVACVRIGKLNKTMNKAELLQYIKEKLGTKSLLYGCLEGKNFNTVALSSGAGEEFAFCADADVFVTGEIKYHTALELKRRNIAFIAAGHYYTEVPIISVIAQMLKNSLDISVYETKINTDPFEN